MTFKFYLAGIYTANFDLGGSLYLRLNESEKKQRESVLNYLESYHYIYRESAVRRIRKDKKKVFLDSGAFSAFTQGVEIDLPGYVQYIKENEDIIERVDGVLMASVLDGIGDPLKTWQNQQEMERLGVRPLPCFHWGEDERYLEHYIANYEYITLGGLVAQTDQQVEYWLDRIWEKYLIDGTGRPKIRVHGFGVSTKRLMEKYPFYSTDSSSWVQLARVGNMLLIPEARSINVSERSPTRKVAGQHLDTLPLPQRKEIERRLEQEGVDLQRMRETYLSRWCYNMHAFNQLGILIDSKKKSPSFKAEQPLLF